MPVPLRFVDDETPGPAGGIGGALYPEWDVHKNKYRPGWCRVIDFPLGPGPDVTAGGVEADEVSAAAWRASAWVRKSCAAAPTGKTSTSTL